MKCAIATCEREEEQEPQFKQDGLCPVCWRIVNAVRAAVFYVDFDAVYAAMSEHLTEVEAAFRLGASPEALRNILGVRYTSKFSQSAKP